MYCLLLWEVRLSNWYAHVIHNLILILFFTLTRYHDRKRRQNSCWISHCRVLSSFAITFVKSFDVGHFHQWAFFDVFHLKFDNVTLFSSFSFTFSVMFMLCFSQLSCFHHTFADCESWLWQFESHVFEFWRVYLSSNSNQSISFLRCLRCVNLAILWNSGPFGNVSPIAPDRQFGNPIFVMVRHVRVSRTLQLSLVSKMKVNDPDRKSGSPIVMMVRHARVSRTFWSSHFLKMQVLHHIDVKIGLSLQLMVHLFSPRSLQPIVFRRVALQRERSPDPYSVPRRPFDLQWTFPICCTRISRTCIYCKLILRWKTAFTSSCLPCRGGHCVCEIRYHSCGPEFLLTSWFKQSIRCRGVQHLWHTARNEAIAIGGKGRLITSLYLQKLVLNCWTSCPFSCVYVANLRLSQKSEFPTAFPTRLTRILDLGTLKAWTTSSL